MFDNIPLNNGRQDSPTLHFITEVNGGDDYACRRPPLQNDVMDENDVRIQADAEHRKRYEPRFGPCFLNAKTFFISASNTRFHRTAKIQYCDKEMEHRAVKKKLD